MNLTNIKLAVEYSFNQIFILPLHQITSRKTL